MTPTTRSNPKSPSSARASASKSPQTRRRPELSYAESTSLGAKERTKRGCWTCRIRRKKCDEENVNGCCKTCRRLELECLGWGTKRAEWMKDTKCVNDRLADIKQQLARQGKIRGQPRSHSIPPGQRPQQPRLERSPTSSDSPSLSTSQYSTTTLVSTSPSSSTSSLTTRQKRHSATAKVQGTDHQATQYSVYLDSPTPAASSLASDDDYIQQDAQGEYEEDAYGSDDIDCDDDDDNFGWPSYSTVQDDCQMTPQSDHGLDVPNMFAGSSRSSRSASPSFVASPLHVGASFPDADSGFTTSFTIHGLGGGSILDNSGTLGHSDVVGSTDGIHHGLHDAFAGVDMSHFSYDMFPMLNATVTEAPQNASMDMSTSQQSRQQSSGGISPPALMTPPVGMDRHEQTTHPAPSPAAVLQSLGITVTTPTGMTRSAAEYAAALNTNHSSPAVTSPYPGTHAGASSYFPQQPLAGSPPPQVNGTSSRAVVSAGPAAPSASRQNSQQFSGTQPAAGAAFGTFTMSYRPQIRAPMSDPTRTLSTFQETLVFYYFNRGVRRMQYLLADDSTTGVTDVMYDLVIRDPLGPVTNAICSLAALHDTRLRIAHGLVHPEDPHAHESAQKLYDDTVRQLSRRERRFTEVEAIASLHLLSFWLFCGGGGAWDSALRMAGDWLQESEVMAENIADPIEVIERWTPTKRFAAQAILWFDILGSCSINRSPRFLNLYRRMSHRNRTLRQGGGQGPIAQGGLFTNQRRPNGTQSELMNQVMGCDDDVMFALAEIADLAAWKARRTEDGTLSNRELVDRCRIVEDLLASTRVIVSPLSPSGGSASRSRSSTGLLSPTEASLPTFPAPPPPHIPAVWDPYNVNSLPSAPTTGSSSDNGSGSGHRSSASSRASPAAQTHTPAPAIDPTASVTGAPGPLSIVTTAEPITLRQLSSNVFREAAFLYLHTVESGAHPGVREIRRSVKSLADSIMAIPSHDLDRSLAFPITIGGCLAETQEHREFFSSRLAMQGTAVGNGSQAKLLMETVWQTRDGGERGVCWRNTMQKLGFELLLV